MSGLFRLLGKLGLFRVKVDENERQYEYLLDLLKNLKKEFENGAFILIQRDLKSKRKWNYLKKSLDSITKTGSKKILRVTKEFSKAAFFKKKDREIIVALGNLHREWVRRPKKKNTKIKIKSYTKDYTFGTIGDLKTFFEEKEKNVLHILDDLIGYIEISKDRILKSLKSA